MGENISFYFKFSNLIIPHGVTTNRIHSRDPRGGIFIGQPYFPQSAPVANPLIDLNDRFLGRYYVVL